MGTLMFLAMPKMTSSPVVKKSLSISEEAWKRAEKLIEVTGFSEAEQIRRLFMAGLVVEEELAARQMEYEHKYLQIENRKLVNRKLKMREGHMERMICELKEAANPIQLELLIRLQGYLHD